MSTDPEMKVRKRPASLVCVCALLSAGAATAGEAPAPLDRTVSETPIGAVDLAGWDERSFIVSPDNRRFAYVVERGGKSAVNLDGHETRLYDDIDSESLTFSPDSRRFAYSAEEGKAKFVVVYGREDRRYEDVGNTRERTLLGEQRDWTLQYDVDPFFSSHPVRRKCFPVFGPDSQRLAYAARAGGKWFLVLDGVEGKPYKALYPPIFSPDGQRLAYVAVGDGGVSVVIDGKEVTWKGASIHSPTFSPDGRRFAYTAKKKGGWVVVVDGQEQAYRTGQSSPGMGAPFFSADGKTVAYVAADKPGAGAPSTIFVNGVAVATNKSILTCPIGLSLDGQRLTYVVHPHGAEGRNLVVDAGREGPREEGRVRTLAFSPDGRRLAYSVMGRHISDLARESGGKVLGGLMTMLFWDGKMNSYVVVDGKRGKTYDEIGFDSIGFTPDDRRVVYFARDDKREFLVVDETEGTPYDFISYGSGRWSTKFSGRATWHHNLLKRGRPTFDAEDRLHYIARRGEKLYLVEETFKD